MHIVEKMPYSTEYITAVALNPTNSLILGFISIILTKKDGFSGEDTSPNSVLVSIYKMKDAFDQDFWG